MESKYIHKIKTANHQFVFSFTSAIAPIVVADPADGLQFVTRFQEGAQNPIPVTEVHHTSVGNDPSDPICRIDVTLQ